LRDPFSETATLFSPSLILHFALRKGLPAFIPQLPFLTP
jgi:hypothetical protein